MCNYRLGFLHHLIALSLFLLLLLSSPVTGNNNNFARLDRAWKQKKLLCQRETCSNNIADESMNCVNECLSKICYDEIYASNPLEDGEIDAMRERSFTACLRREQKKLLNVKKRNKRSDADTGTETEAVEVLEDGGGLQ